MFLSFIIPVYNTSAYLRECLDSVLAQDISKSDYEIICIDDGSRDESPEILREYAEKHRNLRVLRQENAGVSAARNNGVEHAAGDYVWFVDSDDLIARNVLGKLKQIADDGDYDRIAFNYYLFNERFTPEEQTAYDSGSLLGSPRYKNANVVNCLMRKRVIDAARLRFSGTSYGEDSLFMFEYLIHVRSEHILENSFYYYRQRPQSAMTSDSKEAHEKRYVSFRKNAKTMKDYYEGRNGPVPDPAACADLFVSFLQYALWEVSMMPRRKAAAALRELKTDGLYPYRRPAECTLTKSYMTSRTDWYGKLFDFLYLRLSTRSGFHLMRLFLRLRRIAN